MPLEQIQAAMGACLESRGQALRLRLDQMEHEPARTPTTASHRFDCADAARLAGFWADVLNSRVDAEDNEIFATVNKGGDGIALMFIQVPEERTGKNRLHVDLATADWAAEVDRIVGLGAKRVSEHGESGTHWITLTDPEGNVFDLVELSQSVG